MYKKDMSNKNVCITGGGSGMGRACALLFAMEGANVIIVDYNEKMAEESAQYTQEKTGKRPLVIKTDITKEDQVKKMVDIALEKNGKPDVLINCAGRQAPFGRERTDQLTLEEWKSVMEVNINGTWLCIKYLAPLMREKGGGSIVNFASTAGMRPIPTASPYSTSKAAVIMLTQTVALEYIDSNIRVNAISPGHVETPMMENVIGKMEKAGIENAREKVCRNSNPMGRLANPEEVASVALFLSSENSSFITGVNIPVDGGFMCS